jgi:hypothetical protein
MGPEGSSGSIKDAAIDFSAGSLGMLKILTYYIYIYMIQIKCESLVRIIKWWHFMKHSSGLY